jgi:hypothetical protein
MPDHLQRYCRLLLEAGKDQDAFSYFNQALDGYHRLPGVFGAETEQLLFLDLADALDSLNRQSEAQSYWRYLARHSKPGSTPQKIANSRLPGETPTDERKNVLSEAMRDLRSDPGQGELLRRAQWSFQRLALSSNNR